MSVELKKDNNEFKIKFYSNTDDASSYDYSSLKKEILEWKNNGATTVFAEIDSGLKFSSYLGAEVYFWANTIRNLGLKFDLSKINNDLRPLIYLPFRNKNTAPVISKKSFSIFEYIGMNYLSVYRRIKKGLLFIKEAFASIFNFISNRAIYRKKDFWFTFEDCGYKAIGIVSLVSFLVGLILAFVGALQLKNFGAQIYVASMVSLGMTRIMSAIMVGIIMAGRTGASFAATIATMQANEEIDALKTLGIKINDYLVTPRLIALVINIPFLTIIANVLGVLGGSIVGVLFLDISPIAYYDYSIKALNLTNIMVGLFHSFMYGIIISLCSCYEGLNSSRDADGVGRATTQAVVKSLVWMIIATGILTVILKVLEI